MLCLVAQSCPTLVTLWTIAHQAPLSMEFSRQEYWSGLSCPPPGDLPHPGMESTSLMLLLWQAGSLPLVPPGKPNIRLNLYYLFLQFTLGLTYLFSILTFFFYYGHLNTFEAINFLLRATLSCIFKF